MASSTKDRTPIGELVVVDVSEVEKEMIWKIGEFRDREPGKYRSESKQFFDQIWHLNLKVFKPSDAQRYQGKLSKEASDTPITTNVKMGWELPDRKSSYGKEIIIEFGRGKAEHLGHLQSGKLVECLPLEQEERFVIIKCFIKKLLPQARPPEPSQDVDSSEEGTAAPVGTTGRLDVRVVSDKEREMRWKIPRFRDLEGSQVSPSSQFFNERWHMRLRVLKPPGYRGELWKEASDTSITTNVKMGWELPNGLGVYGEEIIDEVFGTGEVSLRGRLPSSQLVPRLERIRREDFVIMKCFIKKVELGSPPQVQTPEPQPGGLDEVPSQELTNLSLD